ncbi:hypothetical protein K2173_010893 [Erythroxylum novogranatense]|uniref:Cytochrome P450 n=1 Tax=Erythroxylum novogranatense TaxID=1862640 RepID=A0AAV8T056_9ROSI|nr:hypothetical protein K2173_010893 [Erythroxylum novogranatense]
MALLLVLASVFVLLLAHRLYQKLRVKLPPGPRPWPVLGNLYDVKPVRFRCYFQWARQYGAIILVWFDPKRERRLKERDQQLADRHRSRSVAKFSRDGQDLIWVRKVCTLHLFSPKRLKALKAFERCFCLILVRLLAKYLGAVALNNISRLVFGKRFVNSEIAANGLKLGASLAMAEHIPWLRWMFPTRRRSLCQARCWAAGRDRLTKATIEEHTLSRKQIGGAKQHFVDALQLQGKYDLSEDTIIGLLWTTAISAEWAMAELIRNPRVQQKVLKELDRVIGLERVLLHPPTPLMFPHRANANLKVGGFDIPKGSNIHLNEEDVDMKGHNFQLLPFGIGRRVCPGAQVGINLVTSMLGHLLCHFSWTPPDGVKPEEIDISESPSLVTYMKSPLQSVATPRLPSSLYKCIAADVSYYVLQRIHIPTLSMGKKM